MDDISKGNVSGAGLPLSALRLLVPPIRMASAAAWQTIQQKVVGDYGIVEEFVSMVTEFVPELLTSRQRAQLILGLRAQIILELCRCEATANVDVVQPHVDRIHTLMEAWVMEVDAANVEIENSVFVDLIQNILQDPGKRQHFFQNIFPEQFGPTFDDELQTLMWLFLSRLEKFLPLQSFQQVASMFVEVSSVLGECMESLSECEELKTLLQYQKDLSPLHHNEGSSTGVSIISALKLPSVERNQTVTKPTQEQLLDDLLSCTPDLERGSLTLDQKIHQTNNDKDQRTSKIKTDKSNMTPRLNGPVTLFVDTTRNGQNEGQHHRQAEEASLLPKRCHVQLERLEMRHLSQFWPERRNRGLKMKKILQKEKRGLWEEAHLPSQKASSPDWAPSEVHDSRGSGSFSKDSSYMAPLSNCSEENSWSYYSEEASGGGGGGGGSPSMADSWSYYSEEASAGGGSPSTADSWSYYSEEASGGGGSCPSTADSWSYYSEEASGAGGSPNTADLLSHYSDDASSFIGPVSASTGDDSWSNCLNKDPPSKGPENISATSRKQGITNMKTSSPRQTQCFICKQRVTTLLREHMKTHFPTGNYACPACDSRFKYLSSLKMHMKKRCFDYIQQQVDAERPDEAKNLYKCNECQEAFGYKVSLDKHKVTHNKLYCTVCRKVLRDAAMLARHKASHTLYQCTRCDKSFTHFLPLQRHFENIHKVHRPFKCSHCLKTLPKLRRLLIHEWTHTGHLPFRCAQCNVRVRSDSELIYHQRVHTNEKPYLCPDCGKTFSQNSNLLRHITLIHSELRHVKRHSCSQCDKSFKEKGALIKHQRSKHLRELFRYPCPYCGKMVAANTLTRHKLMHTGERPFKCTMSHCDKFFRSTSEVNRHVLFHHSTDRPYKCDVCGKGFVKKCFLNAHVKIHSGDKPFVCHICGKAFLKLYSMHRHKKLVHTVL